MSLDIDAELKRIGDAISNRNGPKRVPANGVKLFGEVDGDALRPVAADRHGRIWMHDHETDDLVLIADPEAARF